MRDNLNKEQPEKLPTMAVVLILVIVVGVAAFILIREYKQPPASLPTTEQGPQPNYEVLATDYFEGEIEQIADDAFKVKVLSEEENPFLKGKSFVVLINEGSEIFLSDGALQIISDEDKTEIVPENPFKKDLGKTGPTALKITDLAIGDRVLVLSFEDLKTKTSFVAREIYKIVR